MPYRRVYSTLIATLLFGAGSLFVSVPCDALDGPKARPAATSASMVLLVKKRKKRTTEQAQPSAGGCCDMCLCAPAFTPEASQPEAPPDFAGAPASTMELLQPEAPPADPDYLPLEEPTLPAQ
jgi:hypothetical protein